MERPQSIAGENAETAFIETRQPLLLRWTDPQSGEKLAVVMYGSPEFAHELAELGFEVREEPLEDETASSLFVVIRQAGAREPLTS
jgi:hypothetical protein